MNRMIKRTVSFVSAAVISLCGAFGSYTAWAADDADVKTYKVRYDFGADDVTPGKKTNMEDFEPFETTDQYFKIPSGSFDREGYVFVGWTPDGFYGYNPNETYSFSDDEEEIVLYAVWSIYGDDRIYDVTYDLTFEGQEIERPAWIRDRSMNPSRFFEPDYTRIVIDGAFSHGFTTEGHTLSYGERFIMPDHDVVITPIWLHEVTFTFEAGDVDRLNGNTSVSFARVEGGRCELADKSRFSRSGFDLVGWLSDYDGQVYKCGQTVDIPGVDVTYTAVWEPKLYKVAFKQIKSTDTIRIEGMTDTTITCPEPTVESAGKYFAGWQDDDGNIYQPGEKYFIKGAIPGAGIALKAVWKEGTAPPVEPTMYGDANYDGEVGIADATFILQHIGNPDKYILTPVGRANADCYEPGSGISPLDSLAVQKLDAGEITALPEYASKE